MSRIEQSAALLECSVALKARGSWAGETHIQKSMYLVQELLEEPVGFSFVLYRHGPFSFDLRDQLHQMEAERIIRLEEQPYPYGPKILEGASAPVVRRIQPLRKALIDKIGFVAEQIGDAGVSALERIATALYVSLEPGVAAHDRVNRLRNLKAHIDEDKAEEAFRRLEEIRRNAANQGLIPNPAHAGI